MSTDRLLQVLREGLLRGLFVEEGIDDLLDERDSEAFDSAWSRAHEMVSGRQQVSEADATEVDAIREVAFKEVYRATEDSELAGYVSDDFGLIAAALQADISDPWVNALWLAYKSGRMPRGELAPVSGSLNSLV